MLTVKILLAVTKSDSYHGNENIHLSLCNEPMKNYRNTLNLHFLRESLTNTIFLNFKNGSILYHVKL